MSQGDERAREYIRGVCRDIEEMLKSLPDDDTLRLVEFSNRVGAIGDAEPNLSGRGLLDLRADLETLIEQLKDAGFITAERYAQFLRRRAEIVSHTKDQVN